MLKYSDGRAVSLGDKIDIGGNMTGTIVAAIESGDFSSDYLAEEWNYLSKGILVESSEIGLIWFVNVG